MGKFRDEALIRPGDLVRVEFPERNSSIKETLDLTDGMIGLIIGKHNEEYSAWRVLVGERIYTLFTDELVVISSFDSKPVT